MALPADFSKIFGSTATGGLTPISDVNYAKGWEYVGSNPPTKNDFSYLQNLSDQKSQWLYNYLTTSSNAASRTIGSGNNQVPDMSLFSGLKGENGYKNLPGGDLLQWGIVVLKSSPSGTTIGTFPKAFTVAGQQIIVTHDNPQTDTLCFGAAQIINTTQFRVNAVAINTGTFTMVPGFNLSLRWIAIGS